jgi:protocatechuate 3,4-dioxygenase beta subunit
MPEPASPLSRRAFLWTTLAAGAAFIAAACGPRRSASPTARATAAPPTRFATTQALATSAPTQPAAATTAPSQSPAEPAATQPAATEAAQALPPTPACGDPAEVTLSQTEGPFYTPSSPERTSFLEPGLTGTRLLVSGHVLTTGCAPVPGALLDFWHADDGGQYDNVGYRFRGHFFADDQGRFELETIVPGLYPGRTRHFHVKVQAPNQPVLTTQLYFPDEPDNARDGIFNSALLMDVSDSPDGKLGSFNFVLAA